MTWRSTPLAAVVIDARSGFACGEDPPDGVFQFRMNNVTPEGRMDLSKRRRVPPHSRNLDAFLLTHGDVLFNATNSPELVGKTAFVDELDEPAVFSNHFVRLRSDRDALDGRFLARWLQFQFRRRLFQTMCRQWVNQATVGKEALLALQIPLPPLRKQQWIADLLDRADALRAKRRSTLARLDNLSSAIFLDLLGDPVTNPRGWRGSTLGERLRFQQYGPRFFDEQYAPQGIRIVRITDLAEDGSLDFASMPMMDVRNNDKERFGLRAGDIIFARSGATVGKVALIRPNDPPCIAGAYFITMRFDETIDPVYARAVLSTPSVRSIVARRSRQAAQQNFSGPGLRALPMPVPPLELQREYAKRVSAIDGLKATLRRSLEEFDALFASLQHRSFRGEL